ncbi:DNA-binding protein [Glutamicibacter mishrai]|uniref:DNA-binding protein n=1 Tax=Glutamicibacter mishrai TaxID=1775880 RepID=A0A6H0SMI7_9MICC|nr:DNA-binding protein [Glutamicibacter mishrai]
MAEKFNISPETVRRHAAAGQWPASRIGNRYRFSPDHARQIESESEIRTDNTPIFPEDRIRDALRHLS